MSIIDQISDIEEHLQQIRRDGEKKILIIRAETDNKKRQMREHFAQDVTDQTVNLEKEMLQRVEEYKSSLNSSSTNIKEILEQRYNSKREEILKQICQDFWRE